MAGHEAGRKDQFPAKGNVGHDFIRSPNGNTGLRKRGGGEKDEKRRGREVIKRGRGGEGERDMREKEEGKMKIERKE